MKQKESFQFLNNYMFFDQQVNNKNQKDTQNQNKQIEVSPKKKEQKKTNQGINYQSLLEFQQTPVIKLQELLNYEPTKCSSVQNGLVKAYAANTHQGLIRNYNEDRVSIILNILKPQTRINENWPKCSFFGVYDGHAGSGCVDFLRDNLHQYISKQKEFPWNPIAAIKKGLEAAEKDFLTYALEQYSKNQVERSGSCAIISLIVGDYCYVANVGDCRAILSSEKGKKYFDLSIDHKPQNESIRIQQGGGQIYQTSITNDKGIQIQGPMRVFPGRLSVSRAFGDIEAKNEQFGGNPNVVIAQPDIKIFRITNQHDFMVLGCDGIFDKMDSQEVIDKIWNDLKKNKDNQNLHAQISSAVDAVLKEVVIRKSSDNITLLIIAFNELIQHQQKNTYIKSNSISSHIEILQSYLKKEQDNTENNKDINHKKVNYFNPSQSLFNRVLTQQYPQQAKQDENFNKVRLSFNM
ncbi:unnamed protein product [Paramecium pentaurelia]|uniref:protein-serine/threonine phosphatase n=1 Tax=Paramecium pentaurelia TaxID=43138 RepID=A0A8S1WAM9_9CILI|nr:unnamed protein product [Paramecium pentaurelia]